MPDDIKILRDDEWSHLQLPPLDTEKPKAKHKARKPKRVQMEDLPIASTARFAQRVQCGAPYYGYVKSADNCVRKVSANINDGILELGENIYTVIAGDNLTKISKRFGVSIEDIAKENGINDANYILVGDQLKIPTNDVGHYQVCVVEAKKVETGGKKEDEKKSSLLAWLEKIQTPVILGKSVSAQATREADCVFGSASIFAITVEEGNNNGIINIDTRVNTINDGKPLPYQSVTINVPCLSGGFETSPQSISFNQGIDLWGFAGLGISITLTPNPLDWSINITGTENVNRDNETNGLGISIKPLGIVVVLAGVAAIIYLNKLRIPTTTSPYPEGLQQIPATI